MAEDVFSWPARVEDGLYRIAQEALNNAIKRAAASSVTVSLRFKAGQAVLEISDNGQGFDLHTASQGGGMGLASMRERAEQMRGSLTISSVPGKGTIVKVSVPILTPPR